ncbi:MULTISPECIES: stalk domain-containing protein [unclassified Paenibacillus]|uniref:stalk domain-containing protein n=1 Tax=unclassified Paenibacillus TaxID=185978 RepID=UPI00240768A7|nr:MULTISPECIES: stalk domain-containing protein [unclassified Paenibacillus]MDF9839239.1 hypothetical protein [Paenibacillus sp. PastF-2]MDF9845820.1 hypothetical protein [Paenibacillus sp. PastM-2]MDF9852393.1 hypothetical protein [Paenibacillus sp. PastF-1]MDH6477877.1 hypothetical protein [Paenibacillus sp. PastH-2]MDH6505616.1 hypothetical protein [Paenibacillus sp. PastM-3]
MKLSIKLRISLCIVLSMLVSLHLFNTVNAATSYKISINENEQISEVVLIKGTNYIPLKTAVRQLGYHVEWLQLNRTVNLFMPGRTIEIKTSTGESKVNGKVYPGSPNDIIVKNGITLITTKRLAQITGSSLKLQGKSINISNGNQYVYGESGSNSFWFSTAGELYSMVKNSTPQLIGKLDVTFNEQRYSKIQITPITTTGSFVIVVNTFSGEPLLINTSLKVFIKNNEILQSAVFGDEEALQTSKINGYWVFADSHSMKYVDDNGKAVQSYNFRDLIGNDQYSIDGFAGDLVLVRSETKKVLWILDTHTKQSALLYKAILSVDEQSSIEKNTDPADMHYGDNLHLISVKGSILTFSYFSYLQGAKDTEFTVEISKIKNYLSAQ